jgi:hypothetical protein
MIKLVLVLLVGAAIGAKFADKVNPVTDSVLGLVSKLVAWVKAKFTKTNS